MTSFAIVAALLMAGALFSILPTLLRKEAIVNRHASHDEVNLAVLRDQLRELDADLAAGTIDASGYESSRRELERRVAEDVQPNLVSNRSAPDKRWPAVLVGVAMPVVAFVLYFFLGTPAGLETTQMSALKDQAPHVTKEQLENMVATLAQRLKDQPDDVKGWTMLARSYNAIGRFGDAADVYARLINMVPGNADFLADYAGTLAMSQGNNLQGEPEKLISRALLADPKNIKALALSGSAAFERRDYQAAVAQWKKILVLVPPESDIARSTMSSIGEAQALAAESATAQTARAAEPAAPTVRAAAAAAVEVGGTVELDAALRSKVEDTDTVFIFARATHGPRFPLAVLRKQVKDLPVSFVLDDSMSMDPNTKLSGFSMIVVGARISKSGNATPSAGDFEGVSEPVRPGTNGLKIRINSRHN